MRCFRAGFWFLFSDSDGDFRTHSCVKLILKQLQTLSFFQFFVFVIKRYVAFVNAGMTYVGIITEIISPMRPQIMQDSECST